MSGLTREEILGIKDITTKEVAVPAWEGKTVWIRQLTRKQQDEYLKRQYGSTKMSQNVKAKSQQIDGINLYGHDVFLCVCGICNEQGQAILTNSDAEILAEKNGEAVGFIASEIVKFSGMVEDVEVIEKAKNLQKTPNDSSNTDSGLS
jgi:hypothetical protein